MKLLQGSLSIFAIWGVAAALAADPPMLEEGPPPSADDAWRSADRFEFLYVAKLPDFARQAAVWIPVASSDAFQEVEVTRLSCPAPTRELHDKVHGNKVLYAELPPSASGKAIEIAYRVARREKVPYAAAAADAVVNLQPERLAPADERFTQTATQVIQPATGDLARCRLLYDHVIATLRYDKTVAGWGMGDALRACDTKTGNCTDFHAYLTALARSVGIPARFAAGFVIPDDLDDGLILCAHSWAEFLAAGQWVPVDASEAWKHRERVDYYFGHHPANRFEVSRGRDLVLDPAPASGPPNFLLEVLFEVDGKPVPLQHEFSFRRLRP